MWVKYIEQDWFKEDPEIYEESLQEVCNKLECKKEDVWMTHSDEDFELVQEITKGYTNKFHEYKGHKVYSIYNDGGLVSVFSKKKFKHYIMKIAINGDIIDTKDIYKITKIKFGDYIECHDGKFRFTETVQIPIIYKFNIKLFNRKNINIKHKNLIKIESFRQSIIGVWKENQSEIPQLNL